MAEFDSEARLAAAAWWALVVVALAMLVRVLHLRVGGRRWTTRLTLLALSASVVSCVDYLAPMVRPSGRIGWWCALTALGAAVAAYLDGRLLEGKLPAAHPPGSRLRSGSFQHFSLVAALFAGAVALATQLHPLAVRGLALVTQLTTLKPWRQDTPLAMDWDSLWTMAVLLVAVLLIQLTVRSRSGETALFLLALAWWSELALSGPAIVLAEEGPLAFTGRTHLFIAGPCLLLLVAAVTAHRHRREQPLQPGAGSASRLTVVAGGCGLGVLLISCHHLVVPLDLASAGARLSLLTSAVISVGSGVALLKLSENGVCRGLADIGYALFTLALAQFAAAAVPWYPRAMAERCPAVLNAAMVGMAVAAATWCWLSVGALGRGDWRMLVTRTSGMMRRYAFVALLLALAMGGLMSAWPRLRAIGTPDFSLERVTAGFAGHLAVLLVSLWVARGLRTAGYQALAVLALLNTAGFMLMRLIPYAPRFG